MGASSRLSIRELTVEPGGEQTCEVLVRNTGMVVDQFRLDLVGEARRWTVIEPAELNVYPGEETAAVLRFRPPRSSAVPAGEVPFAVRVASREDPEGSTVEEGAIVVGAFTDVAAEISPRTSRGRRRGRHVLTVENRGNTEIPLDVMGVDPDELLRFTMTPSSFSAPPGTATYVRVRPRPVNTFWRGENKTLPFQVYVTGLDVGPTSVDARMLQEQLLPRWLLPAIALVVAAIAALIGLWFGFIRPAVKSAATDEAKKQTHASSQVAQQAKQTAQQAQANSQQALAATGAGAGANGKNGAGAGAGGAGAGAAGGAGAGSGSPTTTPTGGRIQLNVAPGQSGSQNLPGIPKSKTFQLTDVILENPNGDLGTVFLKRGSGVLFTLNLADFRDLDYHFVSPITVPKGQSLAFSVQCANTAKRACTPAVYLGGYLQ
ncbi:MAG TPA: hypothetical protein VG708_13160 [Mycobacteriales bacterium]|nr:hypothetical protein [Mycobacteriales bacterium]